jgi:transposase InsO family protein
VEPDTRDNIIECLTMLHNKTEIGHKTMLDWIGLSTSKYYGWLGREGKENIHNGKIPRKHWILPWEREAIVGYAKMHRNEGYRRLTYMMLDEDIVAVSPATVYRVLRSAGLLKRWNTTPSQSAKHGFEQPKFPHEHWHIDIKYVNYKGTFLFLISIIDGYSRYIVHHELRLNMQEWDVEMTLQKAIEQYPLVKPRLISDNGSQFISKDFTDYLRYTGLQHVRTSIAHPQSNGKIERYHRTIHEECLMKKSLLDLSDARKQIRSYIEFYNTERLHSALYYLTPEDFLLGRVDSRIKERNKKLEEAKTVRLSYRNAG